MTLGSLSKRARECLSSGDDMFIKYEGDPKNIDLVNNFCKANNITSKYYRSGYWEIDLSSYK